MLQIFLSFSPLCIATRYPNNDRRDKTLLDLSRPSIIFVKKWALQVLACLDVLEIGGDVLLIGKLVEIRLAFCRTDGLAILLAFGIDAIDL